MQYLKLQVEFGGDINEVFFDKFNRFYYIHSDLMLR